MTANVPVKFLFEVGNNMVCGDDSAKNRFLYIMLSFFRYFGEAIALSIIRAFECHFPGN